LESVSLSEIPEIGEAARELGSSHATETDLAEAVFQRIFNGQTGYTRALLDRLFSAKPVSPLNHKGSILVRQFQDADDRMCATKTNVDLAIRDGITFVSKRLVKDGKNSIEDIIREITVLDFLKNKETAAPELYEASYHADLDAPPETYYLNTEFIPGFVLSHLEKFYANCDEKLPEHFFNDIAFLWLHALDNIHSHSVVQSDTRLRNIVLQEDGRVRIIDFGNGRFLDQNVAAGLPHLHRAKILQPVFPDKCLEHEASCLRDGLSQFHRKCVASDFRYSDHFTAEWVSVEDGLNFFHQKSSFRETELYTLRATPPTQLKMSTSQISAEAKNACSNVPS